MAGQSIHLTLQLDLGDHFGSTADVPKWFIQLLSSRAGSLSFFQFQNTRHCNVKQHLPVNWENNTP